jgi:hypothetical protein
MHTLFTETKTLLQDYSNLLFPGSVATAIYRVPSLLQSPSLYLSDL